MVLLIAQALLRRPQKKASERERGPSEFLAQNLLPNSNDTKMINLLASRAQCARGQSLPALPYRNLADRVVRELALE